MKAISTPTPATWTKVLLFVFLMALTQQVTAAIRYVKSGASGAGSSWSNASGDLVAMTNASSSGDEVWVAGGTWNVSFYMANGVKLYGGFAGTETALSQRDLTITANASILMKNDMGYVVFFQNCSASTALNGFTITGGTSSGLYIYNSTSSITNSPTISNCAITGNTGSSGAGVYIYNSSPTFSNCTITGNTSSNQGGSIYSYLSNGTYNNCVFSNNVSTGSGGGALFIWGGTHTFTNCLFSNNSAGYGGAMYNYGGTTTFSNCTLAGNAGSPGGGIYSSAGMFSISNTIIYGNSSGMDGSYNSLNITYSLVQGNTSTSNGNISGTTDPLFVNALTPGLGTGGNYSLKPCSPAVNAGSNSSYTSSQTTDVAGNARFYNSGAIDMGSYELQQVTSATASAAGIVYVKAGANGSGESWSCPCGDIQAAINAAASGNQVWVAGGTFIPNRRSDATTTITTGDRNNAFVLKSGVKIYGGFAGTETSLTNRNLSLTANTSILSGDLNGDDNGFNNNSENAYHVVLSSGDVSTAVLDGFTVQNGNCDNGGGAGIFCTNSSPILKNLIVKGNAGRYGAGLCLSASSPTVTNCTITANAGFYGGGVLGSNCGASFTNVLISGNTAVEQGGGMYNEFAVAPTLTNVTITGNSANYNSGAMYNNLGPSIQIRNCIIYGNNTGIVNNYGTPNIQYSLVQGETSTANGNISGATDPKFVNQQSAGLSASGDYSLKICSPAINTGTNTVYSSGQSPDLSGTTTDLAANARFYNSGTVDIGANEFTGTPYTGSDLLAINSDVAAATISGSTTINATASACRLIATLLPTGTTTAVTGTVNTYVWIESTQPASYVKRHYQITPVTNAATATGRVTLYFTQAEFDAFNAVNAVKLPTGASDGLGIANLLIEKRSGTSSDGTGSPFTYSGTNITINPADGDIVWNNSSARWEVTFDVTGFSGFFVKTQTSILPLTLVSFSGSQYSGYNQLKWTTADEVNTSHYILERSADGNSYSSIASITAGGTGSNTYSYKDHITFNGKLFYRLQLVDVDGKYTYSSTVTLTNNGSSTVSLYPNPASEALNINAGTALLNSRAGLYDANGRLLQTMIITSIPQTVNIQYLLKGLYLIKFSNGEAIKFIKN